MNSYPVNKHNKIRRISERSDYSKKTIHSIIDEALYCNIGIIQNSKPFVIPTIHARIDEKLVFHGSNASRLIKTSNTNDICVTITLLDGVVLARSQFHSSMNYRSVMLFGRGEIIMDEEERLEAFRAISDHIAPGRWMDSRKPNEAELKQTAVIKMTIDSASAKIRAKNPEDDEEDYLLDYWAGVIPISQTYGNPEADPLLNKEINLPGYLKNYNRS